MTATSCSSFLVSAVSDTSRGFRHLAESALLSHDVVSDDFTWPTSDLIVRLYLLASIRHQHRCEWAVSEDTKEALNTPSIFKVLRSTHSNHFFCRSLQVCPQTSHSTFLFTWFGTSSEPQRCLFVISKSQNMSIPDWDTIEMSQAILRAPLSCTTRSMNTAMSV